jgi:hypothetical protein
VRDRETGCKLQNPPKCHAVKHLGHFWRVRITGTQCGSGARAARTKCGRNVETSSKFCWKALDLRVLESRALRERARGRAGTEPGARAEQSREKEQREGPKKLCPSLSPLSLSFSFLTSSQALSGAPGE